MTGGACAQLAAHAFADLPRLNALAWLGADENVYASPDADPAILAAAAEAIAPLRQEARIWIEEDELERTETRKRVRVLYRQTASPLRLDLPFLRLATPSPDLRGLEEVPMRHPEWIARLTELNRLYRKELIDFDTFERLSLRVPRARRRPWP